jgi:hypothetical protein
MQHLPVSDRLYVSHLKGLIWLLLATVAELPPAVSSIAPLFLLSLTYCHLLL